jgi:membrane protein
MSRGADQPVSEGEAGSDRSKHRRGWRWLLGPWWPRFRRVGLIVWHATWHLIDDGGLTLAGHIAFMTLFSMFPFLIFLTTLAGELGQTEAAHDFILMALSALPEEVAQAIRPAIEEVTSTRRTGLMTVSILASIWAVSSGIEALREAVNRAYGIEEPRSIWFCRAQSLLFTIIFSVSLIVVMLLFVIGPVAWSYIAPLLEVPWRWGLFYEALRYFVTIGLLYLVVAVIYRWLPARHLPRREILPGAAVTVVLWLVLASLFSFYLQNLGRFSLTYGSLGGIVLTLMFFYLSALIFIYGAEINSARRRAEAARLRAEREQARHAEATSG